jgi:hypothetical protein
MGDDEKEKNWTRAALRYFASASSTNGWCKMLRVFGTGEDLAGD